MNTDTQPRVVIVGGGFGGLSAATWLAGSPISLTLIDRSNHHLFQPLLYQVATGGLSPSHIAIPIRKVLSRQKNISVLMANVIGVRLESQKVRLADREIPYDFLILSTGAKHGYFGNDTWEEVAPGLKSIGDATQIRKKILHAFEMAEMETDPKLQRALLTFVIAGGGPTGVELAGAIAELAHKTMRRDFRHFDPKTTRIVLVEASDRILATFPEKLSRFAERALDDLGVEIRKNCRVSHISKDGVQTGGEWIEARTVLWAAGVVASPVAKWLGLPGDRLGRISVNAELAIPGHPNVFVIGDAASYHDPRRGVLPGVAPVAIQEGRFVASLIRKRVTRTESKRPSAFHYRDRGNLATIGRLRAVGVLGRMQFKGFIAWIVWVFVHIYFLIGFRNRLLVLIEWAWSFFSFQRGTRLIVGDPNEPKGS